MRTRAEWQALMAEHEKSGMKVREFCSSRGIHPKTFQQWQYQLRREQRDGVAQLVPVQVRQKSKGDTGEVMRVEIAVPGALIRVPVGTDAAYVASLAAAFSNRC